MAKKPNASKADSDQTATGGRLLAIALGLGVLATVLLNFYLAQVRRANRTETFTVYTLNVSVEPNRVFERQDVDRVEVPQRFRESFSQLQALGAKPGDDISRRVGDKFLKSASAGQLLTWDLFTGGVAGSSVDTQIQTGQRRLTLPVNRDTMPTDLRPGMYVDIEGVFPDRGGGVRVLPVMERVRVLAIGPYTPDNVEGVPPSTLQRQEKINIEVRPDQATHLIEVTRLVEGGFELLLRNPADTRLPKIPDGGINPEVLRMIGVDPA